MESLRKLLVPFSVVYDVVTRVRNWAFDNGILKQETFDIPIIAVGNLSTGGTGKTPMIEWLINHHKGKKIAVLSRGYGRSTTGFIELNNLHTAQEVGDEPLQIKSKFGNTIVSAVCEKRADGIKRLMAAHTLDLILLDDAYQHRYVKASHYILLTSYSNLFYDDLILPAGNLRESSAGVKRAQTIIVTKCPVDISKAEMETIKHKIAPLSYQRVHFSKITYHSALKNDYEELPLDKVAFSEVTAVTGIAKPAPFISFLKEKFKVEHLVYGDHHRFRESEINIFKKRKIIITTEKDYKRLAPWNLTNVYYLEMRMEFINSQPDL
ncbi:tetraacyldisaccharide 4'-kinase [Nonlabens sp.]|uniref:tetraacyldisaccharide 4'-kinase n=1 Tax=Nonlabens sp. TaxID=1888209 RepID=UPI003F69A6F2